MARKTSHTQNFSRGRLYSLLIFLYLTKTKVYEILNCINFFIIKIYKGFYAVDINLWDALFGQNPPRRKNQSLFGVATPKESLPNQ